MMNLNVLRHGRPFVENGIRQPSHFENKRLTCTAHPFYSSPVFDRRVIASVKDKRLSNLGGKAGSKHDRSVSPF